MQLVVETANNTNRSNATTLRHLRDGLQKHLMSNRFQKNLASWASHTVITTDDLVGPAPAEDEAEAEDTQKKQKVDQQTPPVPMRLYTGKVAIDPETFNPEKITVFTKNDSLLHTFAASVIDASCHKLPDRVAKRVATMTNPENADWQGAQASIQFPNPDFEWKLGDLVLACTGQEGSDPVLLTAKHYMLRDGGLAWACPGCAAVVKPLATFHFILFPLDILLKKGIVTTDLDT